MSLFSNRQVLPDIYHHSRTLQQMSSRDNPCGSLPPVSVQREPRVYSLDVADELRDYRRRGLDRKIDLLTEQVLGVWVDIAIVEQGNAELSAQIRRSRFRQIND
jgi:hypothetical protein